MKLDQILNGEALFHPTCDNDLRALVQLASSPARQHAATDTAGERMPRKPRQTVV